MKIRVYPYKQGSRSAKALADAVGGRVLKLVGSKFVPRRDDIVINWGSTKVPGFGPATVLNSDTSKAACKLKTFRALNNDAARTPLWTTDRNAVEELLTFPVICRTKLNGHSGEGIVVANNAAELVDAPLYTQYVKKKDEYRIHVFGDAAFFIQRKARKLDVENPNWVIRNLEGGFVFVEVAENEVPVDVLTQARAAVKALGLDFGGVDVIWNEREGKAYVLECNTACGLEERTAERYSRQILDFVENR
jgi:glutathione synthase/RimK-type ligase-like ATP-grasp enzyme